MDREIRKRQRRLAIDNNLSAEQLFALDLRNGHPVTKNGRLVTAGVNGGIVGWIRGKRVWFSYDDAGDFEEAIDEAQAWLSLAHPDLIDSALEKANKRLEGAGVMLHITADESYSRVSDEGYTERLGEDPASQIAEWAETLIEDKSIQDLEEARMQEADDEMRAFLAEDWDLRRWAYMHEEVSDESR